MYTSPVSVKVRSASYSTPVHCDYHLIHIKWDGGFMDLVPPEVFTETDLSKIRKIFKMSVNSDYFYNTDTVEEWREALRFEEEYQQLILSEISSQYDAGFAEISAIRDEKEARTKMRDLKSRKNWALKQVEARRKKMLKCAEILKELSTKFR